jgi:hypothetical protein
MEVGQGLNWAVAPKEKKCEFRLFGGPNDKPATKITYTNWNKHNIKSLEGLKGIRKVLNINVGVSENIKNIGQICYKTYQDKCDLVTF